MDRHHLQNNPGQIPTTSLAGSLKRWLLKHFCHIPLAAEFGVSVLDCWRPGIPTHSRKIVEQLHNGNNGSF